MNRQQDRSPHVRRATALVSECRPDVREVLHVGQGVDLHLHRHVGVVRVQKVDPNGD